MKKIEISAFDLAQRFVGVSEIPGADDNPQVLSMLRLDNKWPKNDEVPWCSAFVNYIAWLLRLPRSKDLRARSWLLVGTPITVYEAEPGFDIVILQRGGGAQPGPDVIDAPGHVGFYAGRRTNSVAMLGGNQSDQVCIAYYDMDRVLGVRRLM
jgi:uncharacterized protein (TIGR02594 family)